jgi:hypothetical protein
MRNWRQALTKALQTDQERQEAAQAQAAVEAQQVSLAEGVIAVG